MFGANVARNITNRELKQARNILGVIGVITIAVQAVSLNDLHHQIATLNGAFHDQALVGNLEPFAYVRKLELIAYVGLGVGVAYLVCAFLVSRKPVFATVTGLVLFIGSIDAQAIVDWRVLFSPFGLGLRIAILIALISAVNFARVYAKNRRAATNPTEV